MYTSAQNQGDTAVVLYRLASKMKGGRLCLRFVHHFCDDKQKGGIPAFTTSPKVKYLFYFRHKVGLLVYKNITSGRKNLRGLKLIGGPPHQIAGYFYADENIAKRYCEVLLRKVLDSSHDVETVTSRRELNRASILRRLFATMYPGQIVLNERDLKAARL